MAAYDGDEANYLDLGHDVYNIADVLDREVVTDWACKVSGR